MLNSIYNHIEFLCPWSSEYWGKDTFAVFFRGTEFWIPALGGIGVLVCLAWDPNRINTFEALRNLTESANNWISIIIGFSIGAFAIFT